MRVDVLKLRAGERDVLFEARERDQPFLPESLPFEDARVDDVRKEDM